MPRGVCIERWHQGKAPFAHQCHRKLETYVLTVLPAYRYDVQLFDLCSSGDTQESGAGLLYESVTYSISKYHTVSCTLRLRLATPTVEVETSEGADIIVA